MATTILHHASQVITLAGSSGPRSGGAMGELGVVEDGSVVIDDGRIAWAGKAAELDPQLLLSATVVDCAGRTVMPAFVDAHTHLVWAGTRRDELEMRITGADYEEIFAAGGGILSSVRQTREATADELYRQSLQRIERMRRCGTTTFEIKSGYGLDLATERTQLAVARRLGHEAGFRVRTTCLAAHAIPAEHRGSAARRARFVSAVCDDILPAVVADGLADYCDVFCDRGAFTEDEARLVLQRAVELGLGLRVHANEFGHTGGVRIAAEFRAATADHLLFLDDGERTALREAGTIAVLLPGTSLVLGKPFADGRALVEADVPIAVATDCNPGSCALENLGLVLGLASYGNRLTPAEAICAATHNAAASLGVAELVGRVEAGLDADLLLLSTPDYRDLVYHAGSPLIEAVLQRGIAVSGALPI